MLVKGAQDNKITGTHELKHKPSYSGLGLILQTGINKYLDMEKLLNPQFPEGCDYSSIP